MATLHQLATLSVFLLMLFAPCISATRVMFTWDRLDQAYLRFEAAVARMLEPIPMVESNLVIRPLKLVRRPLITHGPPDVPFTQQGPVPLVFEQLPMPQRFREAA